MDTRNACGPQLTTKDTGSEETPRITDLGSLEALTEYDPSTGEDYEVIEATVVWGSKNNC